MMRSMQAELEFAESSIYKETVFEENSVKILVKSNSEVLTYSATVNKLAEISRLRLA